MELKHPRFFSHSQIKRAPTFEQRNLVVFPLSHSKTHIHTKGAQLLLMVKVWQKRCKFYVGDYGSLRQDKGTISIETTRFVRKCSREGRNRQCSGDEGHNPELIP